MRGTVARGRLTKELQLLIAETVEADFRQWQARAGDALHSAHLMRSHLRRDEMEIVRGSPRRVDDFSIVAWSGTLPAYLGTSPNTIEYSSRRTAAARRLCGRQPSRSSRLSRRGTISWWHLEPKSTMRVWHT